MTYRELKSVVNSMNEAQLDAEVMVFMNSLENDVDICKRVGSSISVHTALMGAMQNGAGVTDDVYSVAKDMNIHLLDCNAPYLAVDNCTIPSCETKPYAIS